MDYLVKISLGPIQDFIATARRCQDLWFGSWLLSDLSLAVANALEQEDATLIFPAGHRDRQNDPGVANVIVAILKNDPNVAQRVENAQQAMRTRLEQIRDAAWSGLGTNKQHVLLETATLQVNELMEFFWVAVPLENGYPAANLEASKQLAAIKNTRQWTQPQWTTGEVPKSSLDGARESVIHESAYGALSGGQRHKAFGTKGTERLCGIGLLKRRGVNLAKNTPIWQKKPRFHSTSHMAVMPLVQRLLGHEQESKRYLNALETLGLDLGDFRISHATDAHTFFGYDGSLLVETRLDDHFNNGCEDYDALSPTKQTERITSAQEALRELLRSTGSTEPNPYYVFLLADGDRMGKAISGIQTIKGHQALGAALTTFASKCERIVEEAFGSLIFAGGDDVLALLPLSTAVGCARTLADLFAESLKPVLDDHFVKTTEQPAPPQVSLSVGLAICHARDPMSQSRDFAKQAEHLAKERRNSLAVVFAPRGGPTRSVTGLWSGSAIGNHSLPSMDSRLTQWGKALDDGLLSNKTAHELLELADHYQGCDRNELFRRSAEIGTLYREILGRKQQRGGNAEIPAQIHQIFSHREPIQHTSNRDKTPVDLLRQLSAELLIAKQIRRGGSIETPTYPSTYPEPQQ